MEFLKYRRSVFKKYQFDYTKYIKDLDSFNDIATEFWDNTNAQKNQPDNQLNIRRKSEDPTKEWDFYPTNSKHFDMIDARCDNPQSIQYAGEHRVYMIYKNKLTNEWEFPNIKLFYGDTFQMAKLKLFLNITKDNFKLTYHSNSPFLCITREFNEVEHKDDRNTMLKGYLVS